MARGGNNQEDLNMFFMQITGLKKGEQVYIKQVRPTDEKGKYETLENITSVSGELIKVETKTKTFEGEAKDEVVLHLKDSAAKEIYQLTCGLNGIGRSIINLLAGAEDDLGKLYIRVYNNKANGQANIYIENNGAKLSWKYDHTKDLKPKVSVTEKKQKNAETKKIETITQNDYTELNEYLLTVLKDEVLPKVKKQSFLPKTEGVESQELAVAGDGSDDLPF